MYIVPAPPTAGIQSPGEIKRREVIELDTHERRDQEQGGGAGLGRWTSFAPVVFPTAELRTLSL